MSKHTDNLSGQQILLESCKKVRSVRKAVKKFTAAAGSVATVSGKYCSSSSHQAAAAGQPECWPETAATV